MRVAGLVLAGSMVAVLGASGCAVNAPPEGTGHTTSKLLAPKALIKVGASATTRSSLGIAEWRVYKGPKSFVLTGYDADKHAVRGFKVSFVGAQAGKPASVQVHLLDGSGYSGTYDFKSAVSTKPLSETSKQFLIRAASDLAFVAKNANANHSGLRDGSCLKNVGKAVAGGVLCGVGIGAIYVTGGLLALLGAGGACYMAGDATVDMAGACADPNATYNPACVDPYAAPFCTTSQADPTKTDPAAATKTVDSSDPSMAMAAATGSDPSMAMAAATGSDALPTDPTSIMEATNDGAVPTPSADEGAGAAEAASQQTACTSCDGNATSLAVDDNNGDVQLASTEAPASDDTASAGDTAANDPGTSGDVVTASMRPRLSGER